MSAWTQGVRQVMVAVPRRKPMEIPHEQLTAPDPPVVEDLASVDVASTRLAVYGRTKGLFRLAGFRKLESLWISGVNQTQLEVVAQVGCLRSLVIHQLRVADLGPLASLASLEELLIEGNSKAEDLVPIGRLRRLRHLYLGDFRKITNLDPLRTLEGLRKLAIDGGLYSPLKLDSLEPLASLTGLRHLRLGAVRIGDGSLRPLAELKALKTLFVGSVLPVQEYAALAAALPNTRGNVLKPYIESGVECDACGALKVLPTGRGTSFLCPRCDSEKLYTRVKKFEELKLSLS